MTAVEILPAGLPLDLGDARRSERADHVRRLIAEWLVGYSSPKTRSGYRYDLDAWLGYCAASELDPLEAKRAHVDAYLRILETQGVPPASRHRRLSAISSWYSWCVDEEHLLRNPARAVTRPRVDRDQTRRGGLTRPQLEALLEATDTSDHPHSPRESFAFRLMASNGLRIGSVTSANLGDLGTYQGARGITYRGKGGKSRFAPFNRPTAVACDIYLDYLSSQTAGRELARTGGAVGRAPLFTMYGSPTRASRSSFVGALQRLARIALPPDVADRISPHTLRHTFTTLALNEGADIRDLQDALDHASPETTRLYDDDRHNIDRHPTFRLAALTAQRNR